MAMPDIFKLKIGFNWYLLIVLIICILTEYVTCTKKSCGVGITSIGYTDPPGDIILKYGEPLEIICSLNDDAIKRKYDSSKIRFITGNKTISEENVEILNSTSSKLRINVHHKTAKETYYCVYEGETVCFNYVAVGVAPQPVTDFQCRSFNYEKLVCTWTPPENFVVTHYNLTYFIPESPVKKYLPCPSAIEPFENRMNCTWTISTDPQYRHANDVLIFTLNMFNDFGSNVQSYTISTFKYVIPDAPQNLTGQAVSPYSIKLTWFNTITLPVGLHHRIIYCSTYDKNWQRATIITNARKNRTLEYTITGLKYAYDSYDIRVAMRSAVANSTDESLWSKNSSVIIRTFSTIPSRPPRTDIGSFEVINKKDSRDVYVYWQKINKEEENGENLTYHVEIRNHSLHRRKESKKAYAKFENLSVDITYYFNIWSLNEIGRSTDYSVVKVPSDQERVHSPENVMKVTHSNQLDEIKWSQPKNSGKKLSNYTVFWCTSTTNRDRPTQCDGFLNWVTLPSTSKSYNKTYVTVNSSKPELIDQFAVSANTEDGSSGMFWAQCTVTAENIGGKLGSVYALEYGSTWIQITWTQICLNKNPYIIGYEIVYCEVDPDNNCTKPIQTLSIDGDSSTSLANITGLADYTTYKIQIGAKTYYNNSIITSQFSEPLYKDTKEAPPLLPTNITVSNVTATSMIVSWVQPSKPKQYIKDNFLFYNGVKINVDRLATSYKLENLTSYKGYTIHVQACTVECTENSEMVYVMTKMSSPSQIKRPSVSEKHESNITIQWDRPDQPNGPINYYELRYALDGNKTVNNTQSQTKSFECTTKVLVSVRAVNINDDGTHFEGPWSDDLDYDCTASISWLLYLGIAVGISCLAGLSYYAPAIYTVAKRMLGPIDIFLPSGLVGDVSKCDKKYSTDSVDPPSPSEKLLDITTDNIDSSGCSSGQASIVSSVQSSGHLSSDSGTEHLNRSPPSTVILRKRNSGALVESPTLSTRSVKQPTAAPYVFYGGETSSQNETGTNTPQIPLNTLTPNYVPNDSSYVVYADTSKPPNPGYVPYTSQEPAVKSTDYVVAGVPTPKMLMPEMLHHCNIDKQPSSYVQIANIETPKNVQLPWQHEPLNTADISKTGYVCVGDAPPPSKVETNPSGVRGYVPHMQFEMKSIKED